VAEIIGADLGDFEHGRCPGVGKYLGDFERRKCPHLGYRIRYVLKVQSNPDAAPIQVSPADANGDSDGTAEFERVYEPNATVETTAPAAHVGLDFARWRRDGSAQAGNPLSTTMDDDHTVKAEFESPPAPPGEGGGAALRDVILPKEKYSTADYPNLDPSAIDLPIPWGWGTKKGFAPVCVDTVVGEYHCFAHAIKEIDRAYIGEEDLTEGADYEVDLASTIITLYTTPLLTGNDWYYFSIDGDWAINGADYLNVRYDDSFARAANVGPLYEIDENDAWTDFGLAQGAMCFGMYFRSSLSGEDSPVPWVEHGATAGWGFYTLRSANQFSRVGQKFQAPATFGADYYLTAIALDLIPAGAPSGSVVVRLWSGVAPEVRAFGQSRPLSHPSSGSTDPADFWGTTSCRWSIREGGRSQLYIDFKGRKNPDNSLMNNGADVLKDIATTVMGADAAIFDAAKLAALKAAKTSAIGFVLNKEMRFGDINRLLESSLNYRLIPTEDRTFSPELFATGEPLDAIYIRDEDIVAMEVKRDVSFVRQRIVVKYDENSATGIYSEQYGSAVYPFFFYRNEDALEVPTLLTSAGGASAVKDRLLEQRKEPFILLKISVRGLGLDRRPMEKIKVWADRAPWSGGAFDGVLFKVLELHKNPSDSTVTIVAVLDSQVAE